MKTLKFIIPRTISSVSALISSLKDELDVMHDNGTAAPAPAAVNDTSDAGAEQDNTNKDNVVDIKPATGANTVVIAPGEKATGAAGIVEVDSDGVPWDARIHGSSKVTLKRGGTWKLARGTDPALVETVMDELRKTMAAIGIPLADDEKIDYEAESNEIDKQAAAESTTAAPPPPAKTVAPPPPTPEVIEADPIYIVEGSGEFTRDQLLANGWTAEQIETLQVKPVEAVVTTTSDKSILFPDLMAAITAAGLDEATVLVAVQNQGIQATPLLAARPDLVPAVYAELFPA